MGVPMETKKNHNRNWWHVLRPALVMTVLLTGIGGAAYPLLITGVAQTVFPKEAQGSLIEEKGRIYGSAWLAQPFSADTDREGKYLWGRIMNGTEFAVKGEEGTPLYYSGPSNLSPASKDYGKLVAERVEAIHKADPENADRPIPADLVTVSGSGLDPHISLKAAEYQVPRIARNRGMGEDEVRRIIQSETTGRFLGIFGEPAVNVLKVNLKLDGVLQ